MNSEKVTKQDLIDSIYHASDYEKGLVQDVVELVIQELKNSLKAGKTIELRSFGTLEPRLRKGRVKARNPRTGEEFAVPPHYVAVFRAGQEIRNALLEKPVEKGTKK